MCSSRAVSRQAVAAQPDLHRLVVARRDVQVAGVLVDGQLQPFAQDALGLRRQRRVVGGVGRLPGLDRQQPGLAPVAAQHRVRQRQLRVAQQRPAGEGVGHEQPLGAPGPGAVRAVLEGAVRRLRVHRQPERRRQRPGDGLRVGAGAQQARHDRVGRAGAGELQRVGRQRAAVDQAFPHLLEAAPHRGRQGVHGASTGSRSTLPSSVSSCTASTSTARTRQRPSCWPGRASTRRPSSRRSCARPW